MSHKNSRVSIWNPWRELNAFTDPLSRFFDIISDFTPRAEYPNVNIWKGDNAVKMSIRLPGVKPEDIDININRDTITIKGTRKSEDVQEGTNVIRQERISGSFTRSFSLPFAVDNDAVDARYKDGILTITLPKAKSEQPRKIAVKANEG